MPQEGWRLLVFAKTPCAYPRSPGLGDNRREPGNSDCELKSTKLAGARGPYYRRTRHQGTETDDIEASLSYVENKATPALRQVREGEPLTVERKGALAQLFGVQMMRGPAFFAHHEEMHRSVLEGVKASDLKPRHLEAVGGDLDLARRQVIDVHPPLGAFSYWTPMRDFVAEAIAAV